MQQIEFPLVNRCKSSMITRNRALDFTGSRHFEIVNTLNPRYIFERKKKTSKKSFSIQSSSLALDSSS